MLNFFTLVAAGGTDEPHISLAAETVFTIGNFNITNSMIYGLMCAILLIFIGIFARKRTRVKAGKGITQFIEMIIEFVIGLIEGPLGSRAKAIQYAPIFGSFFIFIIL